MAFGYGFQILKQICSFWESRVGQLCGCRLAHSAVTTSKWNLEFGNKCVWE